MTSWNKVLGCGSCPLKDEIDGADLILIDKGIVIWDDVWGWTETVWFYVSIETVLHSNHSASVGLLLFC